MFRAHLQSDSVAKRAFYRTVLMYGFHFLVSIFCTKSIRDTQCGFKLFTRKSAQILFSNLHLDRWAFDIELIYIAEQLKIPLIEVILMQANYFSCFTSSMDIGWSQLARDTRLEINKI